MVVGLATAVAQSGGFALASRLPPEFAQGAMSGQAVSGVVVSLVALATTAYGGGSSFVLVVRERRTGVFLRRRGGGARLRGDGGAIGQDARVRRAHWGRSGIEMGAGRR